jgi:6-pyruvoyl-tetrahydropterin synthase
VDAVTGMVMNLVELKQIMHKAVLEPLDHKVPWRAVRGVAVRRVRVFV